MNIEHEKIMLARDNALFKDLSEGFKKGMGELGFVVEKQEDSQLITNCEGMKIILERKGRLDFQLSFEGFSKEIHPISLPVQFSGAPDTPEHEKLVRINVPPYGHADKHQYPEMFKFLITRI